MDDGGGKRVGSSIASITKTLRRRRIGQKRRWPGIKRKKELRWILIKGLGYLDVMSNCGDASNWTT